MFPRRFFAIVLTLAALASPRLAGANEGPAIPPIPCETVRLANGLRVFLAPDPQARVVSVRVTYDVGSGDDPDGRAGLAHLTEHLVANTTKHSTRSMKLLESIGAVDFNAMTRLDETSYFETVPPERLETVLWLESERMGFASGGFFGEDRWLDADSLEMGGVANLEFPR